jgi:hypothetical protein
LSFLEENVRKCAIGGNKLKIRGKEEKKYQERQCLDMYE